MNIVRVPPLSRTIRVHEFIQSEFHPFTVAQTYNYKMNALSTLNIHRCEYAIDTLLGPPKEIKCLDECNSNSIITMYGNTELTPAVHGCHGNFY